MPPLSKVRIYKPGEINPNELVERAQAILHRKPFEWQLKAAEVILSGEDVILDVGTGSGKTLCFSLPLLLDEKDVALTVSPLTALMIDQAEHAEVPTVAVCAETMAKPGGSKKLFDDIVALKYRQVLVSPEIAVSNGFRTAVLSKDNFYSRLRAVCIDEAHCMSLWGGSFRPDYAQLGLLRGRFPRNVPFLVTSATLPDHVLDDVRRMLKLSKNVKTISVSNARPNVALSVREMKHADASKADLRFLLPEGVSKPEDIEITLVYANSRLVTEDIVDRLREWAEDEGIDPSCIAFYHAKIGQRRKRELEELLRVGKIRILVCTDAVGMGCDMRNIKRVVLWGLPPSFCALVQRGGRAGRNFETLGEAILIVPSSVIKNGTTEDEVQTSVQEAAESEQAENRSPSDLETLADNGVELNPPDTEPAVDAEGVRIAEDSDAEEEGEVEGPARGKGKRRKNFSAGSNSLESQFLSRFVCTTQCRRIVWDLFFHNERKFQLVYPTTTLYQQLPGTRCCDNCEPRLFLAEKISVEKLPGLKQGKKKILPPPLAEQIRARVGEWRDELAEHYWPGNVSLSGEVLLGDDVIDKIVMSGEYLHTYIGLRQHVRWAVGHDNDTGGPTTYGQQLLDVLAAVYDQFERQEEEHRAQMAERMEHYGEPVPVERFYAPIRARGARGQGRGTGRRGGPAGHGRRGQGS